MLFFDFDAPAAARELVAVFFSAGVGVRRDSAPVVPSSAALPAAAATAWVLRLAAVLRVVTIVFFFFLLRIFFHPSDFFVCVGWNFDRQKALHFFSVQFSSFSSLSPKETSS